MDPFSPCRDDTRFFFFLLSSPGNSVERSDRHPCPVPRIALIVKCPHPQPPLWSPLKCWHTRNLGQVFHRKGWKSPLTSLPTNIIFPGIFSSFPIHPCFPLRIFIHYWVSIVILFLLQQILLFSLLRAKDIFLHVKSIPFSSSSPFRPPHTYSFMLLFQYSFFPAALLLYYTLYLFTCMLKLSINGVFF